MCIFIYNPHNNLKERYIFSHFKEEEKVRLRDTEEPAQGCSAQKTWRGLETRAQLAPELTLFVAMKYHQTRSP